MKLSDILKTAQGANKAYGAYAAFGGGGPLAQTASSYLDKILQKSINKSSPAFKATTTTQSGTPVAQPNVPASSRSDLQGADYFANLAQNAQKPETRSAARGWLERNVISDMQEQPAEQPTEQPDFSLGETGDMGGITEDTFSTPTSGVAYSMEKLNELYGTKSPEDLWAIRHQLRRSEAEARAGILPEEEYMQFSGAGVTDGAPRYNFQDRVAVNRATADIFGTQLASIDKMMAERAKADSASAENGGYDFGSNAALDIILGSGKFTKDQKNLIIGSIQSGQDPTTVILNQARALMANPVATDVSKTQQGVKQLRDVQQALVDFYAAGGDTSLLRGNYEKVLNKLGSTKNPKLVAINARIQKALQKYRNAVSGTAYSVQEGADIASIFPGIQKGKELNDTLLEAGIEALQSDIDTSYEEVLGADVYQSLVNSSSQNMNSGSSLAKPSDKPRTQVINGVTYRVYPDGSAEVVSFNQVGGGTKQASGGNRPQRNNNPLNIKASSFTQKFPGVIGIDPKPATDGGRFLTFESPEAGFNAAVKLFREGKSYRGKTVDQALRIWSNNGYGGNIAPQYARMRIDQLPDSVLLQIIQNMATAEGFYA